MSSDLKNLPDGELRSLIKEYKRMEIPEADIGYKAILAEAWARKRRREIEKERKKTKKEVKKVHSQGRSHSRSMDSMSITEIIAQMEKKESTKKKKPDSFITRAFSSLFN